MPLPSLSPPAAHLDTPPLPYPSCRCRLRPRTLVHALPPPSVRRSRDVVARVRAPPSATARPSSVMSPTFMCHLPPWTGPPSLPPTFMCDRPLRPDPPPPPPASTCHWTLRPVHGPVLLRAPPLPSDASPQTTAAPRTIAPPPDILIFLCTFM
jgi:hypothetical protein